MLNPYSSTDDGSFGYQGYNTDLLEQVLKTEKVDKVFSAGPELMEKKVVEICKNYDVDVEVSIERYMKCGFGVCGACCMDQSGKRACVEGTIFNGKQALQIEEFGTHHRDGSATKQTFGGVK